MARASSAAILLLAGAAAGCAAATMPEPTPIETLDGTAMNLPRIKGKFDEASATEGRLQLKCSTDNFTLVFEKAF